MAMKFHREKSPEPEINLIPFIDILLVVVIFLMLSTTYSKFTEFQDYFGKRRENIALLVKLATGMETNTLLESPEDIKGYRSILESIMKVQVEFGGIHLAQAALIGIDAADAMNFNREAIVGVAGNLTTDSSVLLVARFLGKAVTMAPTVSSLNDLAKSPFA